MALLTMKEIVALKPVVVFLIFITQRYPSPIHFSHYPIVFRANGSEPSGLIISIVLYIGLTLQAIGVSVDFLTPVRQVTSDRYSAFAQATC
jgi:hypothetical protein